MAQAGFSTASRSHLLPAVVSPTLTATAPALLYRRHPCRRLGGRGRWGL